MGSFSADLECIQMLKQHAECQADQGGPGHEHKQNPDHKVNEHHIIRTGIMQPAPERSLSASEATDCQPSSSCSSVPTPTASSSSNASSSSGGSSMKLHAERNAESGSSSSTASRSISPSSSNSSSSGSRLSTLLLETRVAALAQSFEETLSLRSSPKGLGTKLPSRNRTSTGCSNAAAKAADMQLLLQLPFALQQHIALQLLSLSSSDSTGGTASSGSLALQQLATTCQPLRAAVLAILPHLHLNLDQLLQLAACMHTFYSTTTLFLDLKVCALSPGMLDRAMTEAAARLPNLREATLRGVSGARLLLLRPLLQQHPQLQQLMLFGRGGRLKLLPYVLTAHSSSNSSSRSGSSSSSPRSPHRLPNTDCFSSIRHLTLRRINLSQVPISTGSGSGSNNGTSNIGHDARSSSCSSSNSSSSSSRKVRCICPLALLAHNLPQLHTLVLQQVILGPDSLASLAGGGQPGSPRRCQAPPSALRTSLKDLSLLGVHQMRLQLKYVSSLTALTALRLANLNLAPVIDGPDGDDQASEEEDWGFLQQQQPQQDWTQMDVQLGDIGSVQQQQQQVVADVQPVAAAAAGAGAGADADADAGAGDDDNEEDDLLGADGLEDSEAASDGNEDDEDGGLQHFQQQAQQQQQQEEQQQQQAHQQQQQQQQQQLGGAAVSHAQYQAAMRQHDQDLAAALASLPKLSVLTVSRVPALVGPSFGGSNNSSSGSGADGGARSCDVLHNALCSLTALSSLSAPLVIRDRQLSGAWASWSQGLVSLQVARLCVSSLWAPLPPLAALRDLTVTGLLQAPAGFMAQFAPNLKVLKVGAVKAAAPAAVSSSRRSRSSTAAAAAAAAAQLVGLAAVAAGNCLEELVVMDCSCGGSSNSSRWAAGNAGVGADGAVVAQAGAGASSCHWADLAARAAAIDWGELQISAGLPAIAAALAGPSNAAAAAAAAVGGAAAADNAAAAAGGAGNGVGNARSSSSKGDVPCAADLHALLLHFTGVQRLQLEVLDGSSKLTQQLPTWLCLWTNLRELSLHSVPACFSDASLSCLIRQHATSLTSLSLAACGGISWRGVQDLAAAPGLRALRLAQLYPVTLQAVLEAVGAMQHLTGLQLEGLSGGWSARKVAECEVLSKHVAATFEVGRYWSTYSAWRDGEAASGAPPQLQATPPYFKATGYSSPLAGVDFWEFGIGEADRTALLQAAPRLQQLLIKP